MKPRLTPLIALKERVSDMGSQKKAAESLGISQQFLSDMLMSRRAVNDRIADLLGLDKEIWWSRRGNPS